MGTKPYILYDNVLNSTLTATSTDATDDYSPAYLSNLKPFQKWKSTSSATNYLTQDMGATKTLNAVAFIGGNLAAMGATVSIEASTTGAFAGEQVTILAGFVPASDLTFIKTFTEVTTYRYVRIKITGGSGAYEIGDIILCDRLEFPQYPDAPFAPRAVESVNASSMRSSGAWILGVITKYTPIDISVSFTWPIMTWINGDFYTFWTNHGRELKPFVWVPNFGEYPTFAYFVSFTDNFKLNLQQSDTTNADLLSLKMTGALV